MRISRTIGAFTALFCLAASPVVRADERTQSFEGWTDAGGSPYPYLLTNDFWVLGDLSGAVVRTTYGAYSGTNAAWLGAGSPGFGTSSWLQTPFQSNGIGTISFVASNRAISGIRSNTVFEIQSSTDTVSWTTLLTATNVGTGWMPQSIPLNIYSPVYARIRMKTVTTQGRYWGLDDVVTRDPPAKATFNSVTIFPESILEGDAVQVSAQVSLSQQVSNQTITTYYRVGTAGAWSPIGMVTNGAGTYVATNTIPPQVAGTRVFYYVNCTFQGPYALSPTNFPGGGSNAPSYYDILQLPYETDYGSMNVTGGLSGAMTLYGSHFWQAVVSNSVVNPVFGFEGITTNLVTTNAWGDNDPTLTTPPFSGTAEPGGSAIPVTAAGGELYAVRFHDTNLAYSIRSCVFQDFTAWPSQVAYGTYTSGNWVASRAAIFDDSPRRLRGAACYLDSNSVAYLQSPNLPAGVGEISFWYRNWGTNAGANPITACLVQKSATGGTNADEWSTVATITNIGGIIYSRYSVTISDRAARYVRLLNSTNYPNGRLCLDEVLVAVPGAGVVVSNLMHTPPSPTGTNAVTVSADIAPAGGATSVVATLYYRSGSAGPWQTVGMTNVGGASYVAASPIPAAFGPDAGGAGLVQYYASVAFSGFESSLSSPAAYPDTPTNYVVQRAQVTISNVVTIPSTPVAGSPVSVEADLYPVAAASGLVVTLNYRIGSSGGFTSIGMSTTNGTHYAPVSSIPAYGTAGQLIQYYISAAFSGPAAISPTNHPVAGSSGPLQFALRVAPYSSAYTNMSVSGSVNGSLMLVTNYLWQGAFAVTGLVDGTVQFVGHNGGAFTWGDNDPLSTAVPVYGTGDLAGATITIPGTNSGFLLFTFDDATKDYSIQRCVYQSFDDWAGATAYGTYTNAAWVLGDGRLTVAGNPADDARVYRGRTAVFDSDAQAHYLLSPPVTAGVGQVSFMYRNWETNASAEAGLAVQVSASPTGGWATVGSVSNVLSQDYQMFRVLVSDRVSRYVRILGSSAASHARLCLDEVAITEPGAGLSFTNVTVLPDPPTVTNAVTIRTTIDPLGDASGLLPVLWYRAGSNGAFESTAMTNVSGNDYAGEIPAGAVGLMQFYVSCTFHGFGVDPSVPVYDPYAGAAAPRGYTNMDAGAFQAFDTWDNAVAFGAYTNSDWVLIGGAVRTNQAKIGSVTASNAAVLASGSLGITESYVVSPLTPSPFGLLIMTFKAKNVDPSDVAVTVDTSSDGYDWSNVATYVNSGTNWNDYTTVIEGWSPVYVRVSKATTPNGYWLGLDNLELANPSAMVTASNIMVHPGYPGTADMVRVSCEIVPRTPGVPVFGIQAKAWYRLPGDTTNRGPLVMQKDVGDRYITVSNIPPHVWRAAIQYYVQSDFNGYYHRPELNRSPYYFPGSTTVIGTNSPAPTSYAIRMFRSDFSRMYATTDVSFATLSLLGDRLWQGVFNQDEATNQIVYLYAGFEHYTGYGYSDGVTNWGDAASWKTNLPLYSTGARIGAPIALSNAVFNGQLAFRINEQTADYSLLRCRWQDFETWSTPVYLSSGNDTVPPLTLGFDDWTTNETRSRYENFETGLWANAFYYTNKWFQSSLGPWGIYDARTVPSTARIRSCETRPITQQGYVIITHEETQPLRGIGTVQFSYSAGNTSSVALTLALWLAPTNYPDYEARSQWGTAVLRCTNIVGYNAWTFTNAVINTNATRSVIVSHEDGNTNLWIDDLRVTEWYADTKTVGDWVAAESWITPEGARGGSGVCCEFDNSRADGPMYLRTPLMTNGIGSVEFWYRAANGRQVAFDVQIADEATPDTWATIQTVTTTNASYAQYAYWVLTNSPVYMRVSNVTTGAGRLQLDDFRISAQPVGDSWSTDNAKMAYDASRSFNGTACFLNNGSSEVGYPCNTLVPPNLRTPYLTNGVGEVSFWCRNYSTTPSVPAKFRVQKSLTGGTNDAEWSDITPLISVAATNYVYFRTSVYDRVSRYVRIAVDTSAPASRLCLDEVLVAEPLAADLSISELTVDPAAPLYTNDVHVYATLYNYFINPSNIRVYAHYQTATNFGSWDFVHNLDMQLVSSNPPARQYTYRTKTRIPAQATDTYVQYWVEAQFDGFMSTYSSPQYGRNFTIPSWYYPAARTNTAYYVVFSCPPGGVWINELNARDPSYSGSRPKYVELAGRAGIDIRNWKLEILTTALATQAVYVIASGTPLTNAGSGYGFWVIGDTNTPGRSMTLTNSPGIPTSGGIRLRRSMGAYEYQVAYGSGLSGLINAGFTNIGNDRTSDYAPLYASGTGDNFWAFRWINELNGSGGESYTAGSANWGQGFVGGNTNTLPDSIEIVGLVIGSNVWITCTGVSSWSPAPWYATNFVAANPWIAVPSYSSTYPTLSNGTYTVWFPAMAESSSSWYRVVTTNAP